MNLWLVLPSSALGSGDKNIAKPSGFCEVASLLLLIERLVNILLVDR